MGAVGSLQSYTLGVDESTFNFSFHNGGFQIKYQESGIRFENLAHLQSIENKCNKSPVLAMDLKSNRSGL